MDANEFLNFLFDRLEQKLKPSEQKDLVQKTFSGALCCAACRFLATLSNLGLRARRVLSFASHCAWVV